MRKPIIAGNWKLNKTLNESAQLVTLLKRLVTDTSHVEVVVCPVFTALSSISEILMDSDIQLGAQDMYWEEKGAFTGEVSGGLLKDAGVKFVIIGHSERRQFFHETHETVNKKTKAALNNGLTPIVCIGEMLAERENGSTFKVLEEQMKGALAGFSAEDTKKMVVAYEPVWAISNGDPYTTKKLPTVEKVQMARDCIKKILSENNVQGVRIIYGGSANAQNAKQYLEITDGLLVGGASLNAEEFIKIVKSAE